MNASYVIFYFLVGLSLISPIYISSKYNIFLSLFLFYILNVTIASYIYMLMNNIYYVNTILAVLVFGNIVISFAPMENICINEPTAITYSICIIIINMLFAIINIKKYHEYSKLQNPTS